MKSKKFAMAIVAITMSATTALAFTACNNGGKHTEHDYTWETVTEATCTTEGKKKGTCSCGDEKTEKIPVLAHTYGDWTITNPTATATGEAVKVCGTDSAHAHDIKVTLPKLIDAAYTVTEGETEDTYEYTDATNGKITFKVAKGASTEIKFSTAAENYDQDFESYFVELKAFTPTLSGKYEISIETDAKVDLLEVYESKEAYEDFEAMADPFLSNAYQGIGLENVVELSKDKEYKLYVVVAYPSPEGAEEFAHGEFTVKVNPVKLIKVHNASLGENTATVKENEDTIFGMSGLKPGAEYVFKFAEGTTNNPGGSHIVLAPGYTGYYKDGEETSADDDNYLLLTASDNGDIYFCVYGDVAGEYKFTVSAYVYTKVTELELKDADGKEITEFTVYLNEENTDLIGCIKALPADATDKRVCLEIVDPEVAEVKSAYYNEEIKLPMAGTGAYIRGLKVGTTKLVITTVDSYGTDSPVAKEVILKVEIKATPINLGDTEFDSDSTAEGHLGDLPGLDTAYSFSGEASTKYVVTFDTTWGFSWSIKDNGDPDHNYLSKWDTVQYLEVTTDAEGNAILLISGNGAGVLHIVPASEFEYPNEGGDDDGPAKDLDGRYVIAVGDNAGYNIPENTPVYFSFTGEANTVYTLSLSKTAWIFGQCDVSGNYIDATKVSNDLDWETYEYKTDIKFVCITTDSDGVAYMRVNVASGNAIDALTLNITKGRVDEKGWPIVAAGANGGFNIPSYTALYLSFEGEANTAYSVTVSQTTMTLGQCDRDGEWLQDAGSNKCVINLSDWATGEWTTEVRTYVITTDENGVAYIRINAGSSVDDLTVTISTAE